MHTPGTDSNCHTNSQPRVRCWTSESDLLHIVHIAGSNVYTEHISKIFLISNVKRNQTYFCYSLTFSLYFFFTTYLEVQGIIFSLFIPWKSVMITLILIKTNKKVLPRIKSENFILFSGVLLLLLFLPYLLPLKLRGSRNHTFLRELTHQTFNIRCLQELKKILRCLQEFNS